MKSPCRTREVTNVLGRCRGRCSPTSIDMTRSNERLRSNPSSKSRVQDTVKCYVAGFGLNPEALDSSSPGGSEVSSDRQPKASAATDVEDGI